VLGRERRSDDWIITTTNGTHVTPVIDRERGSDDWIITTTNGTHVTLPLSRSITGVTCVPFVVVIIQSSLLLSRPNTSMLRLS
jgi:phosphosulfolactate phosphohydrolase-like enzyme